MLTDQQVKAIFRDTYNLFVKHKDTGTLKEIADEFAVMSLSENQSALQTAILSALYKELAERMNADETI